MDKTRLAVRLALQEVKLDVAGRAVIAHGKIIDEMRLRGMETEDVETALAECQTNENLRRGERDTLAAEYRTLD